MNLKQPLRGWGVSTTRVVSINWFLSIQPGEIRLASSAHQHIQSIQPQSFQRRPCVRISSLLPSFEMKTRGPEGKIFTLVPKARWRADISSSVLLPDGVRGHMVIPLGWAEQWNWVSIVTVSRCCLHSRLARCSSRFLTLARSHPRSLSRASRLNMCLYGRGKPRKTPASILSSAIAGDSCRKSCAKCRMCVLIGSTLYRSRFCSKWRLTPTDRVWSCSGRPSRK